mmetsp:Transcript_11641/g.28006  ORF Transcript_11641/g.28006 Transcript_11641/m.28006 type:complete len:201 (-) Transcript_11641:325-927(-)
MIFPIHHLYSRSTSSCSSIGASPLLASLLVDAAASGQARAVVLSNFGVLLLELHNNPSFMYSYSIKLPISVVMFSRFHSSIANMDETIDRDEVKLLQFALSSLPTEGLGVGAGVGAGVSLIIELSLPREITIPVKTPAPYAMITSTTSNQMMEVFLLLLSTTESASSEVFSPTTVLSIPSFERLIDDLGPTFVVLGISSL